MIQNLNYCEKFKNVNNNLDSVIYETMDFWSPDNPPLLIFLSNIGQWIFNNFKYLKNDSNMGFQAITYIASAHHKAT